MLTPLDLSLSFGFGDRLGLATPGHISAVKGTGFSPIFAQQSVRENDRTGRTPQQVMDDARRAVDAAGWDAPWGADADHLKSLTDLQQFVDAGYTFFTVDPGKYVDNNADTDSISMLQEKVREQNWKEISDLYLSQADEQVWGKFDSEKLMRALVKYGKAIEHTIAMYERLSDLMETFDFEVSVDETDSPTTPLEHYFISSELIRRNVRFTSLAPRFIGRFEKGVDYIGDLDILDKELARHAAVTAHFGTYKISLHSGSDKFSVYPLIAKYWGERIHVKTAGTSYLEALRTLAMSDVALFEKIWHLALERYSTDRATYHVSADIEKVPDDMDFLSLLDNFHAREIMHVTFGSALEKYGTGLKEALVKHIDLYNDNLKRHFDRHLKGLQ